MCGSSGWILFCFYIVFDFKVVPRFLETLWAPCLQDIICVCEVTACNLSHARLHVRPCYTCYAVWLPLILLLGSKKLRDS